MTELSPRNRFPFPSEREEPYYASAKGNFLASDAAIWAVSEDGNLTFNGGGLFSWSAVASTLTWVQPIYITPFTSAAQARAIIAGPPDPGGSAFIEDGEILFFTMPRLMNQDTLVSLVKGTRIYQPDGTRMHDLVMFAARVGDTILFAEGKSLKDGESAVLFGGGIGTTIAPHQHQPALIIEPPAVGVSSLDLQVISLGDERLILFGLIGVFSPGDVITGSVSGTTATVVTVNPTYITINSVVGTGFQVGESISALATTITQIFVALPVGIFTLNDTMTAGPASGTLRKIIGSPTPTAFMVKVTFGVFPGAGLLTDTTSLATATITSSVIIGNPTADIASIIPPSNLRKAEIYRNGALQGEGITRDYTLNYTTGIATLTLPTVTAIERFVIFRETIPSGVGSIIHQHIKLPIPIIVTFTATLDMQLTNTNPSPTKLIDVELFRNGALLAEPADYTLDAATGIVTLVIPSIAGELFIADRQVE